MQIDIVAIITMVAPIIEELLSRKVPEKTTNVYNDAAKKNDEVMDSLQDLAIKVKTGLKANGDIVVNDPGKELDIQNLDTGIQLVETMIKAYQSRLDAIKVIKG